MHAYVHTCRQELGFTLFNMLHNLLLTYYEISNIIVNHHWPSCYQLAYSDICHSDNTSHLSNYLREGCQHPPRRVMQRVKYYHPLPSFDALATFVLLAYAKLLSVFGDLLTLTQVFNVYGKRVAFYASYDASIEYFDK